MRLILSIFCDVLIDVFDGGDGRILWENRIGVDVLVTFVLNCCSFRNHFDHHRCDGWVTKSVPFDNDPGIVAFHLVGLVLVQV